MKKRKKNSVQKQSDFSPKTKVAQNCMSCAKLIFEDGGRVLARIENWTDHHHDLVA